MLAKRRKNGLLRRLADYFASAGLLFVIALIAAHFGGYGERQYQGIFKVVDGDSLALNQDRFRLEGIDAPEYRQMCKRGLEDWPCGKEAARFLRTLMKSGNISCNGVGIDKYGRTLVRCSNAQLDINREMVANGWAVAYGDYYAQESLSREKKLGIWGSDFQMPKDWRETHGDVTIAIDENGLVERVIARARLWIGKASNYFSN